MLGVLLGALADEMAPLAYTNPLAMFYLNGAFTQQHRVVTGSGDSQENPNSQPLWGILFSGVGSAFAKQQRRLPGS